MPMTSCVMLIIALAISFANYKLLLCANYNLVYISYVDYKLCYKLIRDCVTPITCCAIC